MTSTASVAFDVEKARSAVGLYDDEAQPPRPLLVDRRPLARGDLAELLLELAAPLLERLGPEPGINEARAAVALAVTFWNASVLASKHWEYPRIKELNELKKRMRGRQTSRDDAATFDLLTERWRAHWLDPRLVESWTYEADAAGLPRLLCTMVLPDVARDASVRGAGQLSRRSVQSVP